jgi:hypothetical protein
LVCKKKVEVTNQGMGGCPDDLKPLWSP